MFLTSSNPSKPGKKEPQNTENRKSASLCEKIEEQKEHTVSAVFSIRKSGVSELLLGLNNVLDIPVLDSNEVRLWDLTLLIGSLGLQQFFCPEKRANVLSTEWRVTVKRHDV